MHLLAVDTSGKNGSIALAKCTSKDCNILEVVALEGGTFSAELVPKISAMLAKHHLSKNDIGAFAVATGPGSFTGLRIGLAAVKGLAEILHKPISAVSLLAILAGTSSDSSPVLTAMDAGRKEFYVGVYENNELIDERLMTQAELLLALRNNVLVTPESALAVAMRDAGKTVIEVARPTSADVARFGWKKINAGDVVTPQALDANYIRRAVDPVAAKS